MSKSRSQALRISYGDQVIPVEVRYTDTQRFTVTVDPDLTVRANAPQTATAEEVTARLEKRAGWISRQRAYFERFRPERARPAVRERRVALVSRKTVSAEDHRGSRPGKARREVPPGAGYRRGGVRAENEGVVSRSAPGPSSLTVSNSATHRRRPC